MDSNLITIQVLFSVFSYVVGLVPKADENYSFPALFDSSQNLFVFTFKKGKGYSDCVRSWLALNDTNLRINFFQ